MPAIHIFLEGPEDMTPIPEGATTHQTAEPIEVAFIEHGMASGAPSVMFRIQLEDGSVLLTATSFQLFEMAYKGMVGRMQFLADQAAAERKEELMAGGDFNIDKYGRRRAMETLIAIGEEQDALDLVDRRRQALDALIVASDEGKELVDKIRELERLMDGRYRDQREEKLRKALEKADLRFNRATGIPIRSGKPNRHERRAAKANARRAR